MPDVSSLLSSWKAERENDAFPRPCFEGVVLVRSDAALLLLLVVDSESELERGRRDSLLYTRKLSVTGWLLPSKPLLGNPGSRSSLSLSLSELELERGLRCLFLCRLGDSRGSWGGPMGLGPRPGPGYPASRFLGGRPGRFGGPAIFWFFLEKRTDVRRPTSGARADEDTLISFPPISWLLLSPPSSWCPEEEGWCEGREEPRSPPPAPPTSSRPPLPPPSPPPPPPSRWCASFRLMTLISFLSALALRDWPMLCLPEMTSSSRACR